MARKKRKTVKDSIDENKDDIEKFIKEKKGTWDKIKKWIPIPTIIRSSGEDRENDPGAKGFRWRIKW